MAVTNGYCTTAELREHLADGSSQLTTAMLERAINASSRAIDRYCGRKFWLDAAVAVRTYTVDSPNSTFVDDIGSRTGVVVETGTDGSTFPTVWASTDYILEPRNAGIVGSGSTADAYAFWEIRAIAGRAFTVDCIRPTLRVTAKFGWSAVPPDVNEACILKAAALFKRKDSPTGVASFGDFGVVRVGRNDPDVMELLSTYKNPVVG